MKRNTVIFIVLIIVLAIIVGIAFSRRSQIIQTGTDIAPIVAEYTCSDNKTITASYFQGSSTPRTNPEMPPVPGGHVELALSDGRSLSLPQTLSADGGRYANSDESVVFWNKGNGLTFTENGSQTYMGCIMTVQDPGGLSRVYENGTQGFSIRIPSDYSVVEKYSYDQISGKKIGGIKFTIPASLAQGTNLGSDSYISVEQIPNAKSCTADAFVSLVNGTGVESKTDGTMTYSYASTTGAGAGNRYQETVYTLPGTNPCVAVRYFIHYSVFQNYPEGTVKEFDENALISQFDSIRRTLVLNQTPR